MTIKKRSINIAFINMLMLMLKTIPTNKKNTIKFNNSVNDIIFSS